MGVAGRLPREWKPFTSERGPWQLSLGTPYGEQVNPMRTAFLAVDTIGSPCKELGVGARRQLLTKPEFASFQVLFEEFDSDPPAAQPFCHSTCCIRSSEGVNHKVSLVCKEFDEELG